MLVLLNSPDVKPLSTIEQSEFTPEEIQESQLIIPKIAVNVRIYDGDLSVLNKGIWHRFPERGDPVEGGNFILSGHRFTMGRTPGETRQKSYLYNIDKLKEGDEILVDWQKIRYSYKITKVYQVKPDQTEIEEPSKEAKLTLYTCTLAGSADGRVVVEAESVDD